MKPKVLIINGSLGGPTGNTGQFVDTVTRLLQDDTDVTFLDLKTSTSNPLESWEKQISQADAFVFATGTYWDSWGSPLQRFLELSTPLEATSAWIGKPALVIVTEHATGGKGVLSRLQGVLNTLGLFIPPFSGIVLSLTTDLALQSQETCFSADFWCSEDLIVLSHNLFCALGLKPDWAPWPTDSNDPHRKWANRTA